MNNSSMESITEAFKKYQDLRYPYAKDGYTSSVEAAKGLGGQVRVKTLEYGERIQF
jgi:hypothetical protein